MREVDREDIAETITFLYIMVAGWSALLWFVGVDYAWCIGAGATILWMVIPALLNHWC